MLEEGNFVVTSATSITNLKQKVTNNTLNLYVERHQQVAAVMMEVISCHIECTHLNSEYSHMPAEALQYGGCFLKLQSFYEIRLLKK